MVVFESHSKLIKRFVPPFEADPFKWTPVHHLIAAGTDSELCYVNRSEDNKDPEYWYLSEKGVKATFGPMGMVMSVEQLADKGLKTLISRKNAYGYFRDGTNSPADGEALEKIIDETYSSIGGMSFEKEWYKQLFGWDYNRLMSRFSDHLQLIGDSAIIPEYTDRMIVAMILNQCLRGCIYCPEPDRNRLIIPTKESVDAEIIKAQELQLKYHLGYESIQTEGLLYAPDLLQLHLRGWTDPIEIVERFRQVFPNVEKLYSFMGVPSVNKTDPVYLKNLFNKAQGINRVLIGIETAHDSTSRFLGKGETYAEKKEALMRLKEAGFKVKPIVLVGMVGEGFYDSDGTFVSSLEGLKATARLMAEFLTPTWHNRSPDKLLISKYVPVEGTPLKRFQEEGKRIKPYSTSDGADKDIASFLGMLSDLGVSSHLIELDYESALEGRARSRYNQR